MNRPLNDDPNPRAAAADVDAPAGRREAALRAQGPAPANGSRARRLALAAAAGVVLAIAAAIGWVLFGVTEPEPRPAPDVAVVTIEGERIPLSSLRGRVVLINFWATSCAICIKEMPAIARMHERLAARGLSTIAVAMPYDRPDFVLHYARANALPFPVALDPNGAIVNALGPVRGTPTLLVIDRAGTIVRKIEGEVDPASLERLLQRALEG